MLSIIVATAKNNVIGLDNKMPWHLPAELAYFKRVTLGHPIVMGRKTFDSIGRPLPGRRNIVVTRNSQWRADGVEVSASVPDALAMTASDDAFVIGGAALYVQALPLADRVYQTRIDATIPGDAFFPVLDGADWKLMSSEHREADEKNSFNLDFLIFERR